MVETCQERSECRHDILKVPYRGSVTCQRGCDPVIPPKKPIRYIQEYLALQRVLSPHLCLGHPGIKEGRRLKMSSIVLMLAVSV